MASVTWPEVVARRVLRSTLAARTSRDRLVEVVRELGGVLVQAFAARGWSWGGRWAGTPDYQHFSTSGR